MARPATGPERRLQVKLLSRLFYPRPIAVGTAALNTAAHRRHFGFRLRLVDLLDPVTWLGQTGNRETPCWKGNPGLESLLEVPMNLTSEQVQAIREGEPVPVVPPEVGQECILLRRDVYDRVKQTMDDDLPSSRAIAGLVRATVEDDEFDDYREYKR